MVFGFGLDFGTTGASAMSYRDTYRRSGGPERTLDRFDMVRERKAITV